MALPRKHHRISPHRSLPYLALLAAAIIASCASPPRDQAEKKEAAYSMYAGYAKDFPDIGDVSPKAAMDNPDAVFIDVRSQKERAVSMIKGAITEEDFLKDPEAFAGKELVAYCTIGYRSGEFAQAMRKKGMTVKNLQAGILGWLFAGGEIDGPDGKPTKEVHVYGETWNLAPDGYKTVW